MLNLPLDYRIFVQAHGFHKTANLLKHQGPLFLTARVTNSAFASELYLKCLILLETDKLTKREHRLEQLFSKLNQDTQQAVEKRWQEAKAKAPNFSDDFYRQIGRTPPETIQDALKECGDAFVQWRYFYERVPDGYFALLPLPRFLTDIIVARKPEWSVIQIKEERIGDPQPSSHDQKTPEPRAPNKHNPSADNQ